MRRKLLILAVALCMAVSGGIGSFAQKPKAPALTPAKTPAKTAAKAPAKTSAKPAAKKAVTTAKKKAPVRRTARRRVARRAPAPANQRVPTKERYTEIQQALADAGYFTGEPNGVWQSDSVDALRAFQDASGFEPTGKIDARSLIKLGLGPTYDAAASQPEAGSAVHPG